MAKQIDKQFSTSRMGTFAKVQALMTQFKEYPEVYRVKEEGSQSDVDGHCIEVFYQDDEAEDGEMLVYWAMIKHQNSDNYVVRFDTRFME